jgi:hypothetical protein
LVPRGTPGFRVIGPGLVDVCRPAASSARQAYQEKNITGLVKNRMANGRAPAGEARAALFGEVRKGICQAFDAGGMGSAMPT